MKEEKNTYSNSYHTTAGIHQIQTTNALYIVMYKWGDVSKIIALTDAWSEPKIELHKHNITPVLLKEGFFVMQKKAPTTVKLPEKYKRIEYFFPSKQYAKIMTKAGDVAFMHWFKVNEI